MKGRKARPVAKRTRYARNVLDAIDAHTNADGTIDEHCVDSLLVCARLGTTMPAAKIKAFLVAAMAHANDDTLAAMSEHADRELDTAREAAAAQIAIGALEALGCDHARAETLVDDLTTELWARPKATADEAVH